VSGKFDVFALFPTPVVHYEVPGSAELNVELRAVIERQEKFDAGTEHSNFGGWQSTWDMDKWGGVPAIKLLAHGRNTANRVTCNRQGQPVAVTWKANMWANVNRTGHGNEFHSHPGSFWAAVYYVDDGGIANDASLGGELEIMDPRAPGVAMYAPQLAFNVPGGLSVGANEVVRPKPGLMVMFPAWLLHQVRPYKGSAERISIAFNLSL
jgi:uncharacterized protein (TIGR02466 family)